MSFRLLLAAAASFITTSGQEAHAVVPPEGVEYVIGEGGRMTPRDAYGGEFREKVIERGEGLWFDRWITGVSTASLTVLPTKEKPTAVVLILPGGGYGGLSFVKEGTFVGEWLRERGVAAGVLKYATRSDGEPALGQRPLKQAQHAMWFLKERFNVPVGVMGFSAGGHLAASVANVVTDEFDSRPAFQVLVYPVISMREGAVHGNSRKNLLGENPTEEAVAQMSMDERVTPDTPPALLIHTLDDKAVPLDNSLRYLRACKASGVPVDLRVYPTGGHGYGMAEKKGTIATWPDALEAWLKANKWAE